MLNKFSTVLYFTDGCLALLHNQVQESNVSLSD